MWEKEEGQRKGEKQGRCLRCLGQLGCSLEEGREAVEHPASDALDQLAPEQLPVRSSRAVSVLVILGQTYVSGPGAGQVAVGWRCPRRGLKAEADPPW